jgi:hypothetical protein
MADNESSSGDSDDAVQKQLLNEPVEQSTSERAEAVTPAAKFTAEHLMRHCPYTVAFEYIDTSLWGIPAPEDADETHATTWVAKIVHDYNVAMVWDNDLFGDYLEDFEGWTKDMFLKVERNTLRSLKTVLRHRGVYTGNNRAKIVDSLHSMVDMKDALEWDLADFRTMDFDRRSKAYKRQQDI